MGAWEEIKWLIVKYVNIILYRVERSNLPPRKNQITPSVFNHFLQNLEHMLTNIYRIRLLKKNRRNLQ